MDIGVQKDQMQNHQHTARLLMEQSEALKQLFQDQWVYVWSLNPDNLFVIDEEQHELSIADNFLKVEFNAESENIIQFSSPHNYSVQRIADFIFNEISFFISDSKSQDSLFLQSKVQVFRQLLVEEFFEWVDGENRVEEFLYNLSENEAQSLDQLMIDAGYYQNYYLTENVNLGKAIPLNVELNFKHLCLINSIMGDDFLPVQKLIPLYEQLCFSASKFIPKPMYRVIQVLFRERFNFADIFVHQQDFKLLMNHANENPNLLAFTTWVKRGYWQYRDILSKESFLDSTSEYWDENLKASFPICYLKRTANWLFKQNSMVLDWVALNIDDANVRVTTTALSFIDTTQCQPEIVLAVLKYFKSSAARFFVQECNQFAHKNNWFLDLSEIEDKTDEENKILKNHSFSLLEEELPASVLYIEEWLNLFSKKVNQDPKISKLVFKQLNRVVQAYLSFLKGLVKDIPDDLIYFIDPDKQQSPCFFHALKKHQLDVNHFRKIFKHLNIHLNHNISVFDSYVADYLIDTFNQHKVIEKNVSWNGLYQQAVKWHEQVYFKDTLGKLRNKVNVESWSRISPQKVKHYENWKFIELNSLEQIINESMTYKHCLALSYSELIASGQYVAFHMSSLLKKDQNVNLTLGCFYKDGVLDFDQLRLPNNEKPSNEVIEKAKSFVMSLNDQITEANKNNF